MLTVSPAGPACLGFVWARGVSAFLGDETSATPNYTAEDLWVRFDYDSSNPTQAGINNAGMDTMDALDGTLRLWRSTGSGWTTPGAGGGGGGGQRDGASVNASGGDFLPANEWIRLSDPNSDTDLDSAMVMLDGNAGPYYDLLVEAVNPLLDGDLVSVVAEIGAMTSSDNDVLLTGVGQTAYYNVIDPEAPNYADPTSAIGVGEGADGGAPMLQSFLGYSRLDGQVGSIGLPGLSGDAFAWGIPHANTWRVGDDLADTGSLSPELSSMPHLVRAGSSIVAVLGESNRLYFDYSTSGYTPRFFGGGELRDLGGNTHTTGDTQLDQLIAENPHGYLLTDTAGNQYLFHDIGMWLVDGMNDDDLPGIDAVGDLLDLEQSDPEATNLHEDWSNDQLDSEGRWFRAGQLLGIRSVYGQQITYNYKPDVPGVLESIDRELGGGLVETLVYNYVDLSLQPVDGHGISPAVESIQLQRDGTTLRSMVYGADYIDLLDGAPDSASLLERTYFRYAGWQGSSGVFILDHAAYKRSGLTEQQVRGLDGQGLIDNGAVFVAPDRGVIPGIAQSSGVDGTGSGSYQLTTIDLAAQQGATHQLGSNVERYETIVTFFDANGIELTDRTEVYTLNAAREVLSYTVSADVTEDGTANPEDWISRFSYDWDGRLLTGSSPSGLTTEYKYFDDDEGDNSDRLKEIWVASDEDPNAANYRADQLTAFTYVDHDGVSRIDTVTEKSGGGALGLPWVDLVTDFDYFFDSNTGAFSVTTTLPDVSVAHHGSGVSLPFTETFDMYGRLVQVDNADGTIDVFTYDPSTLTLTSELNFESTATTQYDELGNIKWVQHPDGTYTYYHTYRDEDILEVTVQSGWPAGGGDPIGRITQIKTNLTNGIVSTSIYGPDSGKTAADFGDFSTRLNFDTNPGPGLIFWELNKFDKGGRLIDSDVNHVSGSLGSWPRTTYEYDDYGRLIKTNRYVDVNDTITEETVYDDLGRVIELKVAGKVVQSFIYDDHDNNGVGEVGDGNITHLTLHPSGEKNPASGSEPNRTTLNVYDWRNRLVASKQGHQGGTGEADINRPASVYVYDNLNRLVKTEIYDADGDTPSYNYSSDSVGWVTSPQGVFLQRTDYIDYDARGQVYQTRSVDPNTSFVVTTGLWYDGLGRVIKQKAPGGLITKISYDALGQATDIYLTDDASGQATVAGDTVLEHTHTDYDDAGNAIFSKITQRNPSGADRVTAVSRYYDSLGRLTRIVDHGTYGSGLAERPQTEPTRSANNRVTTYNYDLNGGLSVQELTHDQVYNITRHDALGRVVKTERADNEEAFILGEDTPAGGTSSQAIADQTTQYFYDGLGRLTSQINKPVGDATSYTTAYDYFNDGTGGHNILLPDENGTLSSDVAYTRTNSFNLLGEQIELIPESGLIHAYSYDVVGRVVQDETSGRTSTVTPAPSDDSQTVVVGEGRYKTYGYDAFGNPTEIKEYNAGVSAPRSTIEQQFNAFGQLTDYTSTNYGIAEHVQHLYDNYNGASRPIGMVYPDGTELAYYYVGDNLVNGRISRIYSVGLKRPGESSANAIETYEYLGVGTPQEIAKLDNLSAVVTETRTFDAFGNLAGQVWKDGSNTTQLNFQYGYDDRGRLETLDDQTAANKDVTRSFDAVGRLTGATGEDWKTDENGLTRSVENDAQRLSQQDAKLPSFQGWASDTNTGWLEAGVDAYRASLLDPSAGPTNVATVQFDPWGRVVGRKAWTISYSGSPSSASATFEQSQQYVYDAAGLLIRLHHDAAAANGDFQTRFVTDPFGRVLEEAGYSKADSDGSLTLADLKRYVWSPVTGDLIYYEADTDQPLDGVYGLRHFTAVDAEGNTVGLFNAATGSVHSRLWYTPSGEMATVAGVTDGQGVAHAAGSAGALSALLKQTRFQYLFGQGRYLGFGYVDLATGLGHGGVTQLAGGLQYDALQNGVVKVIGSAFWDDVNDTAPKPVEYTWWDRYGSTVVRTTVIVGASVAGGIVGGVVTGGNPLGAAFGAYIAGSLTASVFAAHDRYEAGQSAGQALGGGLLDGTGYSGLHAGVTGNIPLDGIDNNLSTGERWFQGVTGGLAFLPVAGAGARVPGLV